MNDLEVALDQYRTYADLAEQSDHHYKELMASEIIAEAKALRDGDQRNADHKYEKVVELAHEYFKETGDKKPIPGIEIRMMEELEYEAGDVLNYCIMQHWLIYMRLDKKAFDPVGKAMVKAGQPDAMDIIEIVERPQVRVSRGK